MAACLARKVFPRKLLTVSPSLTYMLTRTKVGVFERDKKSGYRNEPKPSNWSMMKDGLKGLKGEVKIMSEEVMEKIHADPFLDLRHGDYEYAWKMNSHEEIEKWVVTADRDNSEGMSKAGLVLSKNNTAIFHGYLSQEVPKDGIQKRSGYANIRAPSNFRSFKRKIPYDWSLFNCIVMRVRGDGRSYMLNVLMERTFDINWNDQYNYSLYTRGGPYWQIAKIPFSKFYLTSKGRIQDKQEPILLDNVSTFGITVGDGNEGPFSLEIDYVALMYDDNHYETFAYELYQADPAHVGT